jgi:hypothetical protein
VVARRPHGAQQKCTQTLAWQLDLGRCCLTLGESREICPIVTIETSPEEWIGVRENSDAALEQSKMAEIRKTAATPSPSYPQNRQSWAFPHSQRKSLPARNILKPVAARIGVTVPRLVSTWRSVPTFTTVWFDQLLQSVDERRVAGFHSA